MAPHYKQTVLITFQNVADALRAVQLDAVELVAATAAESAGARSLEIAGRQLAVGAVNYLVLFERAEHLSAGMMPAGLPS